MVLRAVGVAEGQFHHPADDGHRVGGSFSETQPEDAVHPLRMAVTAYIVALSAAGLAGLPPVADGALHVLIPGQVLQRCAADQAFLGIHGSLLPFPQGGKLFRGVEPVLPALCHSELCIVPPGVCLCGPAGRHAVPTPIEDAGGTAPCVGRVLPHPDQVVPGQGLAERSGDLALCPKFLLRHASPAHHSQDQSLHVQDG